MSNSSYEFNASGLIEFEAVAPVPAAIATGTKPDAPVDDTLDNDPLSINFGRAKDTRPSAAERMLAGPTIDWLIAFPADARPKALCDRFPHVANRLAGGWRDAVQSMRSLQALCDDPRWGGAGFPALVQGELKRLLQQMQGARPRT